MIIFKINTEGVFAGPGKSDPVVRCHPNRPPFWVALQAMKAKARNTHILRPSRDFQQLQDTNTFSGVIGTDPAGFACKVDLFKSLVPEASDHCLSVSGYGCPVN